MDDFVVLTHPETGGEAEFPAAAVDAWLARGWQRPAAAAPSKPSAPAAPSLSSASPRRGRSEQDTSSAEREQ